MKIFGSISMFFSDNCVHGLSGSAENRTQNSWLGSENDSSGQCRPPGLFCDHVQLNARQLNNTDCTWTTSFLGKQICLTQVYLKKFILSILINVSLFIPYYYNQGWPIEICEWINPQHFLTFITNK